MQKLVFTNGGGNTIDLTSGNFGITNWEGLSGVGLNIQTQQVPFQDGGVFLDALMEQREISVTVAIQDNNDLSARYERKRELISALNPKLGEGVLIYTNDYLSRQIKAVPQLPIFENKNSNDAGTLKASVTFSCPSPYWEDLEDTVVEIESGNNVIQNNGDVFTPVKLQILPHTRNPVIVNQTDEKLIGLNEGEYENDIIINTNFGNKTVNTQELYFSWSAGGTIEDFVVTPSKTIYVGTNLIIENIKDGQLASIHPNVTRHFYSIIYAKGKYVAVAGSGRIYTSLDGEYWTRQSDGISSVTKTLRSVVYSEDLDLFVVVGNDETILTSSDGVTWESIRPYQLGRILYSVTYGNGIFVAVGSDILTSTDGITWTVVTTSNLNEVNYLNGIFVAVGQNGNIMTSSDGITWTPRTSGVNDNLNSITYGEGLFVITGDSKILKSLDGIIWNQQDFSTGAKKIKFINGMFKAVGTGGTIVTSLDGTNWTQEYQNKYFPYNIQDMIYCEELDLFVAIGTSGSILTSTDGISWTPRTSGTSNHLYSIVYAEEKELFIVVGDRGTILTSTDGISWTPRTSGATKRITCVIYGGGLFVISELTNNKIYTSSNGITWTERTTTEGYVAGIAYKENLFVAVTNDSGSAKIITSTDGITWTGTQVTMAFAPNSICYAEGLFVLVGTVTGGGVIYTSIDGITWFQQYAGSYYVSNIKYVNGQFFALSTTILVSKDGKIWENRKQCGTGSIKSIAFKNGLYIAIGECILNSMFPIEENLISSLCIDSDMTFGLEVGNNNILFTNDDGKSCIMSYRQKYIGV